MNPATFEYVAVPGVDEDQAAAARKLVHAHARDEADEALLLGALFGVARPAHGRVMPSPKCEVCGYSVRGPDHKRLCL